MVVSGWVCFILSRSPSNPSSAKEKLIGPSPREVLLGWEFPIITWGGGSGDNGEG